ncbi:MAG: hypothetical protein R3A13_03150 [Bdellovibrionota bacterium]
MAEELGIKFAFSSHLYLESTPDKPLEAFKLPENSGEIITQAQAIAKNLAEKSK